MIDTTNYKIFTELSDIKSGYEGNSLEKISGLTRSQYQIIKMCEYYSDSRYLGSNYGNKRMIGEGSIDVPFYNIVNFRVALAKTATDIDIKDLQIVSDNPKHQVEAMVLNREAYEWMKNNGFSLTLNTMGGTRPKYGGYLVKKVMTDDKLSIDVVRWTNTYTDQADILSGPIIECHHMSPVDLKKKDGIWDDVIDVLKAWKKIKAADRPTTIDVYEITGEFPVEVYKNAEKEESTDEDKYTYSLQHYFIADVDGKKFKLYCEELDGEMTDYYEYLTWEDNGYGLGRGVIEDCEEAQVWTNDAVINESIAMNLAGRVGIKTNSSKLGNNVLTHDHGKIYKLGKDEDMNSFNLAPGALGQYQVQVDKWKVQGDNVATSYQSATGEQPPSGTPYSQTALLNAVASKPFDYKREEWGIHLTKIFDNWIIPYLIKKIKNEHVLVSEYSDEELDMIDESFANFNANQDIKDKMFDLQPVSQEMQQGLTEGYKKHIKKQGKKRFLEVPEDYFANVKAHITLISTGEQKNKAVILQSLSEIAKFVMSTFIPTTGEFGALKDPTLSKIFNQIIELSGVSIPFISAPKGMSSTPPTPNTPTAPSPISTPTSPPLAKPLTANI